MHACEMHACEMHACEMRACERFCEDLARQNAVAHLSQLQLGFRRCRILVMFNRCGVLKVMTYLGRCTVYLGTSAHRESDPVVVDCFDWWATEKYTGENADLAEKTI